MGELLGLVDSIALRAGAELHQAALLQGLQRAELLPLALRLAELVALDRAAGRRRAVELFPL